MLIFQVVLNLKDFILLDTNFQDFINKWIITDPQKLEFKIGYYSIPDSTYKDKSTYM